MLSFTDEESSLLLQDGYFPGYMMDICEGDLIAIPPVLRGRFDNKVDVVKILTVQRIMHFDASYISQEKNELVK